MIILGIDPGLATMGYGVIEASGDKRKLAEAEQKVQAIVETPTGLSLRDVE